MRIWIFVLGLCGATSLSTIRLPVLVYLQLDTGPYFSLLTGLAGHHVALANPSKGRLIWTREIFCAPRHPAVRAICSRSEKILSGEW